VSKVIRSRMAFRRTARSSDEPALDHLECHGLIRGGVPTTKHLDRSIVIRMSVQHKHKPAMAAKTSSEAAAMFGSA
jgi:hypothetical protein